MKINVLENGIAITREMTAEEEAAYLEMQNTAEQPEPTLEEQITILRQQLADVTAAFDTLLSAVNN